MYSESKLDHSTKVHKSWSLIHILRHLTLRQPNCPLFIFILLSYTIVSSRCWWSSGYRACLWAQVSRVKTRPRKMDFQGDKNP
jgi:hypothetical protein